MFFITNTTNIKRKKENTDVISNKKQLLPSDEKMNKLKETEYIIYIGNQSAGIFTSIEEVLSMARKEPGGFIKIKKGEKESINEILDDINFMNLLLPNYKGITDEENISIKNLVKNLFEKKRYFNRNIISDFQNIIKEKFIKNVTISNQETFNAKEVKELTVKEAAEEQKESQDNKRNNYIVTINITNNKGLKKILSYKVEKIDEVAKEGQQSQKGKIVYKTKTIQEAQAYIAKQIDKRGMETTVAPNKESKSQPAQEKPDYFEVVIQLNNSKKLKSIKDYSINKIKKEDRSASQKNGIVKIFKTQKEADEFLKNEIKRRGILESKKKETTKNKNSNSIHYTLISEDQDSHKIKYHNIIKEKELTQQDLASATRFIKKHSSREEAEKYIQNQIKNKGILKNIYTAWVDGSLVDKNGGIGILICKDGEEIFRFGKNITNELSKPKSYFCELCAAQKAIEIVVEMGAKNIVLCYDCEAILNCTRKKNKEKYAKLYYEFITQVKKVVNIEFIHEKAHASNENNNIVDKLARNAAKMTT